MIKMQSKKTIKSLRRSQQMKLLGIVRKLKKTKVAVINLPYNSKK